MANPGDIETSLPTFTSAGTISVLSNDINTSVPAFESGITISATPRSRTFAVGEENRFLAVS